MKQVEKDIFKSLAKLYSSYNYLTYKATSEVEKKRLNSEFRPKVYEMIADWMLMSKKEQEAERNKDLKKKSSYIQSDEAPF